ncbi:uncharacterized protein FMAN_16269 [Fusarium mangiferae]|uniref:Uncharacterized protein n=1 Tax=Fusarium mangiferae TaxID=192010 RepID=A0A1L7UII8_FUSMA|nr:uncharacterized protein FMAN_16269 [Fusarium mangiferae]CVL09012.1 uncharacterized protein FMAN_16269 [Fusarium mangiferae]
MEKRVHRQLKVDRVKVLEAAAERMRDQAIVVDEWRDFLEMIQKAIRDSNLDNRHALPHLAQRIHESRIPDGGCHKLRNRIWEDDGFMAKAIHKAGQKQSKKGVAKSGPELQRDKSNVTGSHTQHVATDAPTLPLPDQDGSDELPLSSKDSMSGSHSDKLSTSPSRAVSVDSDEGFPAPPTRYPVGEIISRLRDDKCLQSNDIHR